MLFTTPIYTTCETCNADHIHTLKPKLERKQEFRGGMSKEACRLKSFILSNLRNLIITITHYSHKKPNQVYGTYIPKANNIFIYQINRTYTLVHYTLPCGKVQKRKTSTMQIEKDPANENINFDKPRTENKEKKKRVLRENKAPISTEGQQHMKSDPKIKEKDLQVWRHSEIVVASLNSSLHMGHVMHASSFSL